MFIHRKSESSEMFGITAKTSNLSCNYYSKNTQGEMTPTNNAFSHMTFENFDAVISQQLD
jgi:hypothetical protein